MPKRRTHGTKNDYLDSEDNPIGLTGAFAPVKGPQSVDYDVNDDPVGLTSAFGAIPDQDEPRSWDEAGKWKDFDWDAAFGEPEEGQLPSSRAEDEGASEPEEAAADEVVQDDRDLPESPEGRRPDTEPAKQSNAATTPKGDKREKSKGPKHGRHAAPEPELSPRMKKSQRTRRVLIVLVVLLVLVIGALGYFFYNMFTNSQHEASQQAQEQGAAPRAEIAGAPADDASETAAKLADVPDLTTLLGKTQDETIAALGRGALVTSNREIKEEGNPIKAELNVALTEEAADSKTGTPTVYLGLGEDGRVRQAGYSASASALGFGALSFADAVSNEHVVEKTLAKAGIEVPEGSAKLPKNKDKYSTYASDGTTVVRERCSFEGDTAVGEAPCTWSSVLSYDYTTQVVTGNLGDTVRIIYIYITMK